MEKIKENINKLSEELTNQIQLHNNPSYITISSAIECLSKAYQSFAIAAKIEAEIYD